MNLKNSVLFLVRKVLQDHSAITIFMHDFWGSEPISSRMQVDPLPLQSRFFSQISFPLHFQYLFRLILIINDQNKGELERLQHQNKSCLYVFRWEKFHILNQFSLIAIFMLNKSIYIFIDFILNLRNTNFKTTDKKQFYPRL